MFFGLESMLETKTTKRLGVVGLRFPLKTAGSAVHLPVIAS